MLDLSSHLPEIAVDAGHAVVREGGPSGEVWVLVSGSLEVLKGDVVVNIIDRPGAMVGDVSVLLGTDHVTTVVATQPSRLRHAVDGTSLLLGDPEVTRLLAVGLARRLNYVMTYLADLKHQYGEAPGLSIVPDVLGRLAHHQKPEARPGSARDPDPEY
jgi:CRP/FNR family transcriptional regulator, cyclic AMP receptor protein